MAPTHRFPFLLAGTLALGGAFLAAPAPALAATPVSELKDVSPDHWAYVAIQQLIEKYEVMDGFPDKTFRGNRPLTRYEMAAALAKVMAKTEEMIATATGQPVSVTSGVNSEDLRTIARLQREFRDELEVLKSRTDVLDTRVNAIEKRIRWSGEAVLDYRDFLGANPVSGALADMRMRTHLNLDANVTDALGYHGSLYWDAYGQPGAGNAFPTLAGASTQQVYVNRSYASYAGKNYGLYAGLTNVSDVMTIGSTFKNPFTTNVWGEGTGGFGFVGTPGLKLNPGAAPSFVTVNGPTTTPATSNVWYLPGTDVAAQAMDPNATQPVAPRSNLSVVATGDAGPFSAGLAVYQPNVSGRDISRLLAAGQGLPDSFAQVETYPSGARMLASLGADFGLVRAQLAAKTPGSFIDTDGLGRFNKTVSGTLDLGSDALGLSLQAVSRTAFTGNFMPTNASATLASNDIFGTGFGFGLGLNAGSILGTNLVDEKGEFTKNAAASSLLAGTAGMDYASYGLMLRVPGFSVVPNLTFALQQTAGAGFGPTIASGITMQADVKIAELPKIQLEYSGGKFDPIDTSTNGRGDNSLLNNKTFVSNEQLAARMVIPF